MLRYFLCSLMWYSVFHQSTHFSLISLHVCAVLLCASLGKNTVVTGHTVTMVCAHINMFLGKMIQVWVFKQN